MPGSYSHARLAYVLRKDPFSQEANVVQAMRMVDAFAGLTPDVQLPIPSDWPHSLLLGSEQLYRRLHRHYGFSNRFAVAPITIRRIRKVRAATRLAIYHRRAVRHLIRHRPDLVMTRSERVVRLCCKHRLPVVYETHAGPNEVERLGELGTLCAPASVVGVVTIDDKLADLYASHGVPRSKLLALPDGIPQASLTRQRGDKCSTRDCLGLDRDAPLVLYTGSLQAHKGIPTLIEAARRLPDVRFVLVGRALEPVWALAGNQSPPDNCLIMDYQPPQKIPAFLDAADICVLPNAGDHPSMNYTSPLKLFEYMASGTPIVASAVPAVCKTLNDGYTACLFKPDDASELACRIRTLLADPAQAHRLAENAHEKVAAFTWEQRAERILETFLPQRSAYAITSTTMD